MAVNTTNYKFNKPVVGADTDNWGDELNENWDKIDSLLYGASYTDDDSNTVERIQPDLEQGSWAVNGTAITATAAQLNAIPAAITGAATTIDTENLTANRALISNGDGKVAASGTITTTELGHLNNVSSNIQTQLNAKQATITGAATTIDTENLTANRALLSNGSGKVAVSAVTNTELGRLTGVTSGVQTQLDAKAPKASPTFTGTATIPTATITTGTITTANITTVDLGDWTISEDASNNLLFKIGDTTYMKLDSSGNLSIAGSLNANATL